MTGTSAGAGIAALICTHTDDELRKILVPELANRITPFSEPASIWVPRFLKERARFDARHWARVVC